MMHNAELKFAKKVALEAGEIMLKYFKLGVATKIKEDNTPVTVADEAINDLVIQRIKQQYPDHDLIGEEASWSENNADYVWYCDPIDGTRHFAAGLADNVFSLGLTHKGKVVLGVIYDPYQKRLFEAVDDLPSLLNGDEIKVQNKSSANPIYDFHSRFTPYKYDFMHLLSENKMSRLETGSIAYSVVLLAAGQSQTVIFDADSKHDVVAVHKIALNAGATVTDAFGDDIDYTKPLKGFVASHPDFHQQTLDLLNQARKKHIK